MANIKLYGNTWDSSNIYDEVEGKTQKAINADVSELKTAIKQININGYEHEDYKDVTALASNIEGAYAEIYSGSIKITPNNSYHYAVIDVTAGETYRTTGLYAYDIYPAIYTNDAGTVILKVPSAKSTTWQHVTIESTAPEGATKLYVSERNAQAVAIEKYGNYYVEEDSIDNLISVSINNNVTLDTTIITKQGNEFRHKLGVFNASDQPNHAVLPRSCEVNINGTWKTIVNNEDDNCPVQLSSGYIGAGHGYSKAQLITLANHGKTYEDIGSEWVSVTTYARHWWIIRIVDDNHFVMLGQNDTSTDYDTTAWTGGDTITHVSGGVHTGDITGFTRENYLISPLDKNHIKKVVLDGVTEVSENGEYNASSFVDVIDEYDIVNPQSIVPQIIENKPSGGYTDNPDVNTGNAFLHFSNVYRILADGTMLLFSTLDNSVNVALDYWGGTQFAQKSSMNEFGGGLYLYVPKMLEVSSKNMRIPVNLSGWNTDVNADESYWEDENNPPDRVLQLFTDANSNYVAGFACGYLPIAYGSPTVRKNNTSRALSIYRTKKVYFRLINNNGVNGSTWSAYTPFQCIVYRKPVLDVGNKHTDAYFVPCGDKCYLYADYHVTADDRIKVPAEYIGKPITVLEKSDNVTVYGTIATDEIQIRAAVESPDIYGYAVVQIG